MVKTHNTIRQKKKMDAQSRDIYILALVYNTLFSSVTLTADI